MKEVKSPKEIFDRRYEFYRNMLGKPAIPLEAFELIFGVAKEYHSQFAVTSEDEKTISEYEKDLKEICDKFQIPPAKLTSTSEEVGKAKKHFIKDIEMLFMPISIISSNWRGEKRKCRVRKKLQSYSILLCMDNMQKNKPMTTLQD